MTADKALKIARKQYYKTLKRIHKNCFKSGLGPMDYFIAYLEYIRDCIYLLAKDKTKLMGDSVFVSLAMALQEFGDYTNCYKNYFDENDQLIDKETPEAEVLKAFLKEKLLHWTKFCELVHINYTSWETYNELNCKKTKTS